MPLSTAVHTSARFTYVSPAGTVYRQDLHDLDGADPRRWIRLVDGGYFENSGTVTATEVLAMIVDETRDLRKAHELERDVRPIIVHISNDPQVAPKEAAEKLPGRTVWMGEVLSPLYAILHVRSGRGIQARELVADLVDDLETCGVATGYEVHFRLWQRGKPIPLGWTLSQQTRDEIVAQLEAAALGLDWDERNRNGNLNRAAHKKLRDALREPRLDGEAPVRCQRNAAGS